MSRGNAVRRLYVETLIRTDPETLWARTQEPGEHQRWDLRFTEITYLPKADGEPQRFRYATRLFPSRTPRFLTVAGTGTSAGETRRADGTRVSALRFASPHPLSLLKEGSGYWRYVPVDGGVRFLTGYDYRPRWGRFGRVADRWVFRPLMGWATAWSFDRLRLWCEAGVSPERARAHWLAETASRLLVPVAAAVILPPAAALLALAAAVLLPPSRLTPAARRCLRTAPPRTSVPALLDTLEPA
ncbi:hypothetical protein AB0903_04520 [Streptomyces sp. NPDC048389]|uniref:hypothetical protein n=1 Tax=Streptomyces sp. NPDC048389 TaxID=3154622 RepID=UPI003455E3AD